ncbi:mannosyltransferase family protein [Gordonia sp. NPDC127522]|uniref:mannosyltransferase family protein n=1 Tax=Gordonia sp. NPDC127522 TaxID=3345390 RepID=UPI00363D2CC2
MASPTDVGDTGTGPVGTNGCGRRLASMTRGYFGPLGSSPAAVRGHRWWLDALLVFLVIRAIGILVLARFADLRGTTLGDSLAVWDGQWMIAIATHGYDGVPYTLTDARGLHTVDTAYAFFPGYPYLVGLIAKLPGLSPFGAAITVNLVLGCVAAVGAARLGMVCARLMARRSPIGPAPERGTGLFLVVLFAATPMSIVLNMAYTEALFCALAVWALVGVLEKRWLLAGIVAALCGLCRPTAAVLIGVVMLAALVFLWQARGTAVPRAARVRAIVALVISPLGYLAYLCVVWTHTGSPTGWFRIQTEGWDTQFDWGVAAFEFINEVLVHSAEVAPVATSWIVLSTLVMLGVAVWSRVPWPVLLYGSLLVAQIVLSSGLMMSRPRLLLPAFVLLIPLAMALARMRPVVAGLIVVPIVVGSSWFGAHMLTVFPHAM